MKAITFDASKPSGIKDAKQKYDEFMKNIKSANVLFTLNPVSYMNATDIDKIRELPILPVARISVFVKLF